MFAVSDSVGTGAGAGAGVAIAVLLLKRVAADASQPAKLEGDRVVVCYPEFARWGLLLFGWFMFAMSGVGLYLVVAGIAPPLFLALILPVGLSFGVISLRERNVRIRFDGDTIEAWTTFRGARVMKWSEVVNVKLKRHRHSAFLDGRPLIVITDCHRTRLKVNPLLRGQRELLEALQQRLPEKCGVGEARGRRRTTAARAVRTR